MENITRKTMIASIGASAYSFFVGWSFTTYSNLWKAFLILSIIVIWSLLLVSVSFNKERLYKLSLTLAYFGLLLILSSTLIVKSGILADISDPQAIVDLIQSSGGLGKLIFVLIMILQVTFIPIPSTPVVVAGALIFSSVEAMLLSALGLILGSVLAFALGRFFGQKLVKWIIGEDALVKYRKIIGGRDKALLIFMFIMPGFPDDVLCLIAGITNMGWPLFLISQLVSRPLNTAMTVYTIEILKIIPLKGWGLAVWALVLIIFIAAIIIVFKKAEQLEATMLKLLNRLTGKTTIGQVNLDKLEKPVIQQSNGQEDETLDADGDAYIKMDVPPSHAADVILTKKEDDIKINF